MTNRIVYLTAKTSLLLFSALFLFASCIKDDLDEDCRIRVHFDYSHNMTSVNLFGEQVDKVTLYVFDENGTYMHEITEQGDHITNDYVMMVPLYNDKYQFVTFAQSTKVTGDRANFTFPTLIPNKSKLSDLEAAIQRQASKFDGQLNNLLVGYHPTIHIDYNENTSIEMKTKKITNTVRVTLVDKGREPIDTFPYAIRIEDKQGNGIVGYDFKLRPDAALTYLPYYTGKSKEGEEAQLGKDDDPARAFVSSMSLSQMEESHTMQLIILSDTGEEVKAFNLFELIQMLKEQEDVAVNWSFQEFMDREDLFEFTFYVNEGNWLSTVIIINDWVLNLIDIEL